MDRCRGHRQGPGQSTLVVVHLGDAGQNPRNPYAVTAHPNRDRLAVLIQDLEVQGLGVLEPQLEDLSNLHSSLKAQRTRTVRTHVAMTDLRRLDHTVSLEVTPIDGMHKVLPLNISPGCPFGTGSHMGINQIPHMGGGLGVVTLRSQDPGSDVSLDEFRMGSQVDLVGLLDFRRGELRFKPLHIDLTVSGQTYSHKLPPSVRMVVIGRMLDGDDQVLQGVLGGPLTPITAGMEFVQPTHHALDGLGIGCIHFVHIRSGREVDHLGLGCGQRLNIPGLPRGSQGEGVLTDGQGGEELLGLGSAHGTGDGMDNHIVHAQPLEDALIRSTFVLVGLLQPLLIHREGIGILHNELTATNQPCAWTELVTVLGLNLVEGHGKVLV